MNARVALSLAGWLAAAGPVPAQEAPKPVVQAGHTAPIISASFSHDGELVATTSADKTTKVWHVPTGALLRTFAGHPEGVRAVALRPDGKDIVTGGRDRHLNVHDGLNGFRRATFGNPVNVVYALAYSRDSDLLAVAGSHTRLDVLDARTGRSRQTHGGLADGVNCLAFSDSGKKGHRLAAGDKDGTIHVFNALAEKPVFTIAKAHPNKDVKKKEPYERGVLALDYSPDGKLLASAGADGAARVWNAANGKPLPALGGLEGRVTGVGFAGANLLLTTLRGGAVRFWDATTGQPDEPNGKAEKVGFDIDRAAVSPDGKHLLLISGSHAYLFTVDAGERTVARTRHLTGVHNRGYSSAVSPDGHAVAVGMNGTVGLWRPGAPSPVVTLRGLNGPVFALAFSPDGKFLAAVSTATDGEKCFVHTYDVPTGRRLDSDFAHSARTLSAAFNPDGTLLATASHDGEVGLWKVNSRGGLDRQPPVAKGNVKFHCVAFSPDGKLLAAGGDGRVAVWEVPGRKHWHTFSDGGEWLCVAFGPGGALAAGNQFGETNVWDLQQKKLRYPPLNPDPKAEKSRPENHVFGLAYSPDGRYLVTAHGKAVLAWDAAAGKLLNRSGGQFHVLRSVGFTKDGKFLVGGSGDVEARGDGDAQAKVWEFDRGKNLLPARPACTLVSHWDEARKEQTWAVIDHAGRYDASRAGEVSWLHYVVDNEPVTLSQLKDAYYEPLLLSKILGLNPEAARTVVPLAPKLPPRVEVKARDAKAKTVTLGLTDRGGGVGRVQVLLNGKEVAADARPARPGGEVTVDLSRAPLRGAGDRVRVVTWNADGSISSRGAEFDLGAAGPPPAAHKPELYAVVVGVSSYKNPKLDLKFPAKDAEDLAAAVRVGGSRLFGAGRVHLTLLTSPGAKSATRENIEAAFREVARQAHPDDVFLVFFAGHGVTIPGQELYCYLTANARALTPAALAAPDARGTVVTSEDLVDWIRPIKADKQMMVLDTCAAGGAAAKLVPSSQIRAVERLKGRTGFHILMGCAADRVSYEANQLQHGLLTYSLLEGMQGAGIRNGDRVDVTQLFHHAWYMVPKLAEGIGGVQRPLISSPQGNPFDVAELTALEREGIKLPQPVPRLCRPRLADASGGDTLGLEERVEAVLDDASAPRGDPVTFVPCAKLANAYRPVGKYEVKGNKVTVTLRVESNGKEVTKKPLTVTGTKDKPDELAKAVARALVEWARK